MNPDRLLSHAADLLRGEPFAWTVTVEYPGYLLVTFPNFDGTCRAYAAGFANPTLTVHTVAADGTEGEGIDTRIPCGELDSYRLAIHVAAAIDRLEH